jgi:sialate O-acetylesterase
MARSSNLRLGSGVAAASACLVFLASAQRESLGDVKVPAIFGPHMVLQRHQKDRIWGWAEPGEEVTVKIDGQTHSTKAGTDGSWQVMLDPMQAGGPYTLSVTGKNTLELDDVLVGEVWICSGQSNMQWPVVAAKDFDVEMNAANQPRIRLISVPQVGTQEPQKDFVGKWQVCRPDTVRGFSAVGYFFGRRLQAILDVPIGLINDAWGGSACEAWIRRDLLAADQRFSPLLRHWEELENGYPRAKANYESKMSTWRTAVAKAKTEGEKPPPAPENPDNLMHGNSRPGNIYNGVLKPTIGFGIRGVIWYQGESNAGRAYQYRELFPLLIKSWRDEWAQGDFSFYWVQLADFLPETPEPRESGWAELREAQTMTLKLPNTGQAVIIDLGEAQDVHPRNKQDVANRLVRWALARDYGLPVTCESPTFKAFEQNGNKLRVQFDHVGTGLKAADIAEPRGFAVAGDDHKFVWARARIIGPATVEVWSDSVSHPIAIRYAWADNPVCNIYSSLGLPLTPFRTDDWPGVTIRNFW